MIVTRLQVANLRCLETAEFSFREGMNLIAGINGAGKTSILEALRVCLSGLVIRMNALRFKVGAFSVDDVRVGTDALTVECDFKIGEREHSYVVHRPREVSTARKQKTSMPRRQIHDTPERAEFVGSMPTMATGNEPAGRPLAVLFSGRRAVPAERAPSKAVARGGIAGALADAFANRELRLGEFAGWMQAQQAMRQKPVRDGHVLAACEDAVQRFLPDHSNLRLEQDAEKDHPCLWIDQRSTSIPVRQLSDGERGSLALVLDLTRRLAQANPEMDSPATEAEAVVLIDEIDLHLHPKWQRQIVHNLTAAFPRCQFIATTHSPQVIGEVSWDRIQIIEDGQVYSPTHSYGVDSSRILEEVMDTPVRAKEIQKLLNEISEAIGKQRFDYSHELVAKLAKKIGEGDPEVTRHRMLLDFLEVD